MKSIKTKGLLTILLAAAMTTGSIQEAVYTAKAQETTIKWDKAAKEKYKWLDELGNKLTGTIGNGLLKISNKKGDKFGLAKKDGTVIYEPQFERISERGGPEDLWYYDGNIILDFADKDGRYFYGLMSPDGKKLVPVEYEEIAPASEGMMRVAKNGKYGYLNEKFKLVIPCKYDEAEWFRNGISVVKKGKKYGAVDKNGKTVIPFKYDEMLNNELYNDNQGKYIIACKNDKYGLLDSKGKVVLPLKYDGIKNAGKDKSGLAYYKVWKNNKVGFVNENLKEITKVKYDNAGNFYGNLAIVEKKEKLGAINNLGKEVVPVKYQGEIESYYGLSVWNNGEYLALMKKGYFGLLDKTGKEITPFKYLSIEFINKDTIIAEKSGSKVGVINNNNKVVVPFIYQEIKQYFGTSIGRDDGRFDNVLKVSKDGKKYGYIDFKGNIVIPIKYSEDNADAVLKKKLGK